MWTPWYTTDKAVNYGRRKLCLLIFFLILEFWILNGKTNIEYNQDQCRGDTYQGSILAGERNKTGKQDSEQRTSFASVKPDLRNQNSEQRKLFHR